MKSVVWAATLLLTAGAAHAGAQSLADVARQEEARRKAIARPGKVLTNDDLRRVPPPQVPAAVPASPAPAPPSASGQASPAPASPTGPETEAPAAAQDEGAWRDRITAAREGLARSQAFADALQSQINALATDFAARDDPAQRAQISTNRQRALAELDRVKGEIAEFEKQVTAIQEEARRAGVPAGWVR